MLGSPQKIDLFECGQLGGVLATGTSPYTGSFGAVKALQESTVTIYGTNIQGLDGYQITLTNGDTLLAHFVSGVLASGAAIFYKD